MVMRIYCDYCRQTWDVYSCDDHMRSHANRCPHCGAAKIEPERWKDLLDCLHHMEEVNTKLYEDHVNDHKVWFAASFLADSPFRLSERDSLLEGY